MEEQQPELRWAPLPPKPKKTGKVWLIIGASVAALAVIGALVFFFFLRGDAANPEATPEASASPSAVATAPAIPEPTMEEFRGQVSDLLNDASVGLDLVASASGQEALSIVDTLQLDSQRLSDAQPPTSIAQEWRDGVSDYAETLTELSSAVSSDTDVPDAVEEAKAAVQVLQGLVGL